MHEKKKNWLESLQKTPSEKAPKHFLYYQLIGRRDPGRTRRKWLSSLMFEDGTG
jgi:hypothetical protein